MTAAEAAGRTGSGRAGNVISREICVTNADSDGSRSGTSASRTADDDGAPWSSRVILPAGTELMKKSHSAAHSCGLRVLAATLSRIGGKNHQSLVAPTFSGML